MKIITEREELLVCKQYAENWTLRKIASSANLSQSTVMAILKRRNIPLRNGKQLSAEQEQKVIALYSAGAPINEIKEKSDVKSEQTIYRILRDAGVGRRNTKK